MNQDRLLDALERDGYAVSEEPCQTEAELLDFASSLGEVLDQFGDVNVLDVVPREGAHPNGPFGRDQFPLHMDGVFMSARYFPTHVIFRAVSLPQGGSRHLLVDTRKVDARMSLRELDRLRSVTTRFTHPDHECAGDPGVLPIAPPQARPDDLYHGPVSDGSGWLRLLAPLVRVDGAFAEYFQIANQEAFELGAVRPGSVWVLDNRRVLHGRLPFEGERSIQRVHIRR